MAENEDMLLRNISDTALWTAVYRADESDRSDALFIDPFARRLSGERGERIKAAMPSMTKNSWAIVMRTYLFDDCIQQEIAKGADMVINLAAGLDTRPYRMNLPASLQWIEVDLPAILTYKEAILKEAHPLCHLERVPVDLSDSNARQGLLQFLAEKSQHALVLSEGLLIYLDREQVGQLAQDLSSFGNFKHWVIDIASPVLLKMMQKQSSQQMEAANASFKFAPDEGPDYFTPFGWDVVAVHSIFKAAAQNRRLNFFMSLMARLPESPKRRRSVPWSGVCLLKNKSQ